MIWSGRSSLPKPLVPVVVIDDHAFVREAIEAAIEAAPDLALDGSAADGAEAVALITGRRPDVAIMDFALPDMTGLDAVEAIRAAGAPTRFVLLTGAPLAPRERDAVAGRVEVFLHKESGQDALLAAVRAAAAAPMLRPPPVDATEVSGALNAGLLTLRERAVLREIARGRPVDEIAARLGVSPATVRKHRENIMSKLNLNSTAALVRAAMQIGQY